MASPAWLTTREASRKAGVSDAYLRRLCEQGKLNAQLKGNSWLIDPMAFERWQQDRKRKRKQTE
jgi:excisionase family DNA binding protein